MAVPATAVITDSAVIQEIQSTAPSRRGKLKAGPDLEIGREKKKAVALASLVATDAAAVGSGVPVGIPPTTPRKARLSPRNKSLGAKRGFTKSLHPPTTTKRKKIPISGSTDKPRATDVRMLKTISEISTKPCVLPDVQDCFFCGAMRFAREPPGFCCAAGKVSVPLPRKYQSQIDIYVKIETQRLDYLRFNQSGFEMRSESYGRLVENMASNQLNGRSVGHRVHLSPSFTGGPRDIRRRFMNALAIVAEKGRPDLFITATCNLAWLEIQSRLLPVDLAQNRADLVVRVFRAKNEEMKKDIVRDSLFGEVAGYFFVIELQKRGLPHAHWLIILKPRYKITSIEAYDRFVSAEIPDPAVNPHIHKCVLTHMMHGPCGDLNKHNVCMVKGQCRNFYPKSFQSRTEHRKDSYPDYMRRENGVTATVRGKELDNHWAVPSNPYLLAKFDCNINMQICNDIKGVKYLYKYCCKGNDQTAFNIVEGDAPEFVDEIADFQKSRWLLLGEERDVFLARHSEEFDAQACYIKERLVTLDLLLKLRLRMYNLDKSFTAEAIQILDGSETFLQATPKHLDGIESAGTSTAKKRIEFANNDPLPAGRSALGPDDLSTGCRSGVGESNETVNTDVTVLTDEVAEVIDDLEKDAYDSDYGTPTSRKLSNLSKSSEKPAAYARLRSLKKQQISGSAFKKGRQSPTAASRAKDISLLLDSGYSMAEASETVNPQTKVSDQKVKGKSKVPALSVLLGAAATKSEIYDLTVGNDEEPDLTLSELFKNKNKKKKTHAAMKTVDAPNTFVGAHAASKSSSKLVSKFTKQDAEVVAKAPTKKTPGDENTRASPLKTLKKNSKLTSTEESDPPLQVMPPPTSVAVVPAGT